MVLDSYGTGNVETILNNQQQVAAAYRYDPFGVLLAQTGSLTQPYGFSTKRYDPDIGMIQYEYRNYFPSIGRWGTRDPLGEAGGMNLYAFVGNNPVNWVDPFGLDYDELYDPLIALSPIPIEDLYDNSDCSVSPGECYMNCLNTLLGKPLHYVSLTANIGMGYIAGSSPVTLPVGDAIYTLPALQFGGGLIGGNISGHIAALRGTDLVSATAAGTIIGKSLGAGLIQGFQFGGVGLVGGLLGVGVGCAISCEVDPDSYAETYWLGDLFDW